MVLSQEFYFLLKTGSWVQAVDQAGETWLRGTEGNAGKIPKQIADKL